MVGNKENYMRPGLFLLLGAVFLVTQGCERKAAAPPAPPEVAVVTARAERVMLATELPGRIAPYRVAEIRAQVSGVIRERLFKEGADLKQGDLLYRIDPAPYKAAYNNAKASLLRAEANLSSIRSRAERYKDLVETRAVSDQDYDDASSALKQVEAEIEIGKAAVETARINLGYTRITAPISGLVGRSAVTVGALAIAYQGPPFTTIQQIDPVYVDVTQSTTDLAHIRQRLEKGQLHKGGAGQRKVRLILEGGKAYPEEGTLQFRDITVDRTTESFVLRMVFPNPKHVLLPGMYVRAVVQEGIAGRAILIPQQGVTRDLKGNAIALIVDDSCRVQQRALTLDRSIGDKWLVSSGIAPGDRVIIEGMQRVRPGDTVKVVPLEGMSRIGNTVNPNPSSRGK